MEVPTPPVPGQQTQTQSPSEIPGVTLATSGQRFGNLIIDGIFIYILQIVFSFSFLYYIRGGFFVNMFIGAIYYVVMEAAFGKTVGKFITGTKVVSLNGSAPTFGDIILRTLIRFIPFEAFSYFFYGSRPRGWHDRWSNTAVKSERG